MPDFNQYFASFRLRGYACIFDDAGRFPRAVLVADGSSIQASTVNELVGLTGGLTFVAISNQQAASFGLEPMALARSSDLNGANSTSGPSAYLGRQALVSVEAREGVTTGISAEDRSITIRALCEPTPNPRKIVRPGHIFPIAVVNGGVLVKNALAEAAYDFIQGATRAQLQNHESSSSGGALFLDLLNSNGELMSEVEQLKLCSERAIPRLALSEIVRYRLEEEVLVTRVTEAQLPTRIAGDFRSVIYRSAIHEGEHVALIKGDISAETPVLVRVQSENPLGDLFGNAPIGTKHADARGVSSRSLLHASMQQIEQAGCGVIVYLRKSNRSVVEPATAPIDSPAMMREYGIGAQILRDLGVRKARILTNSTRNLAGVKTFGIEIVAQCPIDASPS